MCAKRCGPYSSWFVSCVSCSCSCFAELPEPLLFQPPRLGSDGVPLLRARASGKFLYGIQGEAFFPGAAVVAAAALNLSRVSFCKKVLGNLVLAFIATYTFANGMLLWGLAWPLAANNESSSGDPDSVVCHVCSRGAVSISCYFIGYHRPSYHPELASVIGSFWELLHYLVLWVGRYFASDFGDPLILGIIALITLRRCRRFCF